MIELIGFEKEYSDLLKRYKSNNLPNSILIHGLSGIGKRTFLKKLVKNISPGIIRKGIIIRSLIHDPEILIMDDPTAFMDAESYRQTWDMLLRMKGEKTILYVSQSLKEVEDAHDRILVLEAVSYTHLTLPTILLV